MIEIFIVIVGIVVLWCCKAIYESTQKQLGLLLDLQDVYNAQDEKIRILFLRLCKLEKCILRLEKTQDVKPFDLNKIMGTWPGEDDDGFEESIDELRK